MKIKIKDIKIGKRFRQDLGNIDELAESLKEHGQLVPIVLDKDNNLIDGERRIKAFKKLKLDEVDIVNPEIISSNKEAEAITNKDRKQWDVIESVAIWDALEKPIGGKGLTRSDSDQVRIRASKLTPFSHDTLSKAKQVIEANEVELIKELRETGNVNNVYKKWRTKNKRKQVKEEAEEVAKMNPKEQIKEKYDVVVIDPPWNYGTSYDSDTRRVASPYPEMSYEQLEELKIPSKEDSVLWLWTTHKFMGEALTLMETWGYEYKAILVWDKEKLGMGSWLRMQCEFCLLGVKGKYPWDNKNIRDIIRESRTTHSTKPESFYKIVEKLCVGRKLDYFARKKREGWDTYGNEV